MRNWQESIRIRERLDEAQSSIEALYALNHGALLQRGLRLPIKLDLQGTYASPSEAARYRKTPLRHIEPLWRMKFYNKRPDLP